MLLQKKIFYKKRYFQHNWRSKEGEDPYPQISSALSLFPVSHLILSVIKLNKYIFLFLRVKFFAEPYVFTWLCDRLFCLTGVYFLEYYKFYRFEKCIVVKSSMLMIFINFLSTWTDHFVLEEKRIVLNTLFNLTFRGRGF